MGLQSELEDIAYDSIPILLLTIIAAAVRQLRSVVFKFIHHRIPVSEIDECLSDLVGTVLASLIVLAEQLNLNIAFSNELKDELNGGSDCVVCLCELRKGERVRRLECRHVFHKKCLDGWLKQLHFSCPLCRSPVQPPSTPASGVWFRIR
ncbi:hypothetical protein QQ045_019289 [Rhodiola kirilowii]